MKGIIAHTAYSKFTNNLRQETRKDGRTTKYKAG